MTHPEWTLKYKRKGTELRNIKGRFYRRFHRRFHLYRISSKWNKERKVSQKITHEMLGRITEEDGFLPRGTKRKRTKKLVLSSSCKNISMRESGASTYLKNMSQYIRRYREIIQIITRTLVHRSPLKNMEFLYENSMLSEEFKGLDLSKNKLTTLIQGAWK